MFLNKRQNILLIKMFPVILFGFLTGCIRNDNLKFPTLTPAPTDINCPPSVQGNTGELYVSPTLIVALFEANQNYSEYTKKGTDILFDALSNTIGTGDKLLMFRMEPKSFEDALIARSSVDVVSAPAIPPIPTIFPTISPVSTYDPNCINTRTSFACSNEERKITEKTQAIAITATYQALIYQCVQNDYANMVDDLEEQWVKAKATAVTEFSNNIQSDNSPVPDEDVIDDQVYEGLSNASLAFENLCKQYKKCKLVIFSDLTDWRYATQPTRLKINLSNVDVITIMLNCQEIFQPTCQKWVGVFNLKFEEYGADKIIFVNGENATLELIKFIKE